MLHAPDAINAKTKPEYIGQVVSYISPVNSDVLLFDIAKGSTYHNRLTWYALYPVDEKHKRELIRIAKHID